MITVYKQFSVCHIGKGIDREIVYTPDLKPTLVLGQTGNKLPEQAYGCKHTRPYSSPYRKSSQKIPGGNDVCYLMVLALFTCLEGKFIKFLS